VKLFLGLQLVKWVLEVLKRTLHTQPKWQQDCSKVALEAGLKKNEVYVKGPGNGRESAIRSLHNGGIEVQRLSMLLQCLTMDVVLQRDVEFNNI
jgi:hypothetical protein